MHSQERDCNGAYNLIDRPEYSKVVRECYKNKLIDTLTAKRT